MENGTTTQQEQSASNSNGSSSSVDTPTTPTNTSTPISTSATRKARAASHDGKTHIIIEEDPDMPHSPRTLHRVPTRAELSRPNDPEEAAMDQEEAELLATLAAAETAANNTVLQKPNIPLLTNGNGNGGGGGKGSNSNINSRQSSIERGETPTPPPGEEQELPAEPFQPRAILKKKTTYHLPPPPQYGSAITNTSSNSSGNRTLSGGPTVRRSVRQLSFADELGRDLHEVHTAANLQYSSTYRRHTPVSCCTIS